MKGRTPALRSLALLALAVLPSAPALAAGPDLSSSTPINFANLSNMGGAPQVAVHGTTAVLAFAGCRINPTTFCPAILYRLVDGVWVETARLQPAASEVATDFLTNEELSEGFGTGVAVSSDGKTVFVGDSTATCSAAPSQECGVIDVYQEPASGWQEMTPTAQLTASTSTATLLGSRLLLSGNDLFAIGSAPSCCTAVYEFTKPAGGWTHATVSAVLSATGGAFGIWGGALAYDASASTLAVTFGTTRVYVFQGTSGSFSSGNQTATLSGSMSALDRVGDALSISGGVVAVGRPGPFGDSNGAVLVFVEPPGGWADMTAETAVLSPASFDLRIGMGAGVLVDGDTILASGGTDNFDTSELYKFKKPSGGWVTAHEDSAITLLDSGGGTMSMAGSSVLETSGDCVLAIACSEANIFPAAVHAAAAPAVVMQVSPIPDAGFVDTSSHIPVVVAGQNVTVEFGVQNAGDAGANDVTLSIVAPSGTSGYSTDAGGCPLANGIATCTLGFLPGRDGNGVIVTDGTVSFTAPAKRKIFTLSASVTTSSLNWDPLDGSGSIELLSDNPPIARTINLTSKNGQKLAGQAGATDADQDTLTYTLNGGALHGTGTLDAQGRYTYAPSSATYVGNDSLFYTVTDGLLRADGFVQIDLNPPAQPVPPPEGKSGGGDESVLALALLLACLSLRRRIAA